MKSKLPAVFFIINFSIIKGNFHYFHVILRFKVFFVFQLNKLVCG